MGAGGTDPAVGYDLMNDAGMAGAPADQRGPHYFDIRIESVFLQRDKSFDKNVDFTALNVGGPVVLSSRDLDIENVNWGFPHLWAATTSARLLGRRIRLHGRFRL